MISQSIVLGVMGASNGISLLVCIWLWGRVRHLEGVIEGRRSVRAVDENSAGEP